MNEERQSIPCAYEGCKRDAVSSVKTKTGMANMCSSHGDMYHLAMCKQFTAGLGLKTRQDLIDFCRNHPFGKGKMHGEFLRQHQKSARQQENEKEAA